MRFSISIAVFLFIALGSALADDFDKCMELGKAEFKKDFDAQNYLVAVENLEKAVKLRPENAEAHYFLGYAYSRLNAKDGRDLIKVNRRLTIKSSEEFELVNRLQPKYAGETIQIDPYCKLTSDWASLGMSYWFKNKLDSAKWAFKEGKKRGGFGEFLLAYHRAALDRCSKNAILLTAGDASTFPLWYLQAVENYRTDVSVVDINLLNTEWYPRFLQKRARIKFDIPNSEIDTLGYCRWRERKVVLDDFSWYVKGNYENQYMLRANRLFLSILIANNFKREVFFTNSFSEDDMLNLHEYLKPLIVVSKLDIKREPVLTSESLLAEANAILPNVVKANANSSQELCLVDYLRYNFMLAASSVIGEGRSESAQEILSLIDKYAPESSYPYQEKIMKENSDQLREWLRQ